MVRAAYLPPIPFGWQLISAEAVIYQGNSMTRTLMFLYNPTTRQSAVWAVDL